MPWRSGCHGNEEHGHYCGLLIDDWAESWRISMKECDPFIKIYLTIFMRSINRDRKKITCWNVTTAQTGIVAHCLPYSQFTQSLQCVYIG